MRNLAIVMILVGVLGAAGCRYPRYVKVPAVLIDKLVHEDLLAGRIPLPKHMVIENGKLLSVFADGSKSESNEVLGWRVLDYRHDQYSNYFVPEAHFVKYEMRLKAMKPPPPETRP